MTGTVIAHASVMDIEELFLTFGNRMTRGAYCEKVPSRGGLRLRAVYGSHRDQNRDRSGERNSASLVTSDKLKRKAHSERPWPTETDTVSNEILPVLQVSSSSVVESALFIY